MMNKNILYRLIKLDLTQFATFENAFKDDDSPLELSSAFRFSYNFDDKVVSCTTSVIITKNSAPILKAELDSYFNIQSESVAEMMEHDCLLLPTGLMTQFASLGYGSMRGVLYAKTMGTPLEKIILPPNNIRDLFTTPVKFCKSK
ncbi:MAG: hypothetical protein HDR87_09680 [Bacteroides sp.]|nr:hypothetical protein [Bacteroides sp.]MBD5342657.1 hypothetical protein [Bacteroides sp.]MBD5360959.1 hypothetical protein [Bacteroides sp.]MBD5371737.1 hypothetical protein [Bacteroides sp.]